MKLKEQGYEVVQNPFKRKLTKEELFNLLQPSVIGLIAGLEPLDREVLQKSSLKVISRCGSGMSNVDLKAAEDLGIKVFSTPNGPTRAVAELTVGALLSLLRNIPQMNDSLHSGLWDKKTGSELFGKTIAILGFGRIGRAVAQLVLAFGAHVYAVDPFFSGLLPQGVVLKPLEEALKEAHIITIHCDGNKPILGNEQFQKMKEGSYLLNAARGELVDELSLVQALEVGKIRGAWLDTFSTEPYQGALTSYKQVILTPHIGSYTTECRQTMETAAVDNLLTALRK
ncbi:MAG: phosphoglycerate dehydrogenase [bacterium]|nr:phosphoglycerate dehydrogenase [bacterium]